MTKHSDCPTCGLEPCFDGWDECLACGVATSINEDPSYIDFARRVFADDVQWLARLDREWERQQTARPLLASALRAAS